VIKTRCGGARSSKRASWIARRCAGRSF